MRTQLPMPQVAFSGKKHPLAAAVLATAMVAPATAHTPQTTAAAFPNDHLATLATTQQELAGHEAEMIATLEELQMSRNTGVRSDDFTLAIERIREGTRAEQEIIQCQVGKVQKLPGNKPAPSLTDLRADCENEAALKDGSLLLATLAALGIALSKLRRAGSGRDENAARWQEQTDVAMLYLDKRPDKENA